MKAEFTTLTYDIETGLNKSTGFGLGEQRVSHNQLIPGFSLNPIICLSYMINDGPCKTLSFDINTGSAKEIIEEFDRLVKSVDIVIGKNNTRFDNKHVNTHRMINDLDGFSDWGDKSDDLETQMRRFFYLPSQSLDYISNQLGLGGKVKMDYSDWFDILKYQSVMKFLHILHPIEPLTLVSLKSLDAANAYCLTEYKEPFDVIEKNGLAALKKMEFYNRKDVRDTRAIWNYCEKHFKPRFNKAVGFTLRCRFCNSEKIHKDGTDLIGMTRYQRYHCTEHNGNAGKLPINKDGVVNTKVPLR